jgi:excisionase family DNA binding protein
MSDLYGTREAAAYLQVSEASVRRWADAGLIAVQRIGLRRARRFARADLERFAEDAPRVTAVSAADPPLGGQTKNAQAGLAATPGAAQLGPHDHFATFYDSDGGRLRLSLPFLRDGLLAGHRCFLVASQKLADDYLEALSHENGVDPKAAVDSRALVLRAGAGSSSREAVAGWEQLWWQALGAGAGAIRVVGEMASYVGFPSPQDMLEYEVAYDSLAKRFPVMTLCQYDVRQFDGLTVTGAIEAHPDLFSRRIADFLI